MALEISSQQDYLSTLIPGKARSCKVILILAQTSHRITGHIIVEALNSLGCPKAVPQTFEKVPDKSRPKFPAKTAARAGGLEQSIH